MTNEFFIENNNKKELLKDFKSGVRKDQIDEKFQNLFDAYDLNGDGTLNTSELEYIKEGLSKFAGEDKIFDSSENKQAASLFSSKLNMEDVDFSGFVKSVSEAGEDVLSQEETQTPDGGKEIKTTYSDGTIETVGYYSDRTFKYKKTEKNNSQTKYTAKINGQDYDISKEQYDYALNKMNSQSAAAQPIENIIPSVNPAVSSIEIQEITNEEPITEYEISEEGEYDIGLRQFLSEHFVETHETTQDALNTMGILDDIGAAINAGGGELWNTCKNVYNKYFGDGTQDDYKNFYELVQSFETSYDKSILVKSSQEIMQKYPDLYFNQYETDFKETTGHEYNLEEAEKFQQVTEQYEKAQILQNRLDILNKASLEISQYQYGQDYAKYSLTQNTGFTPANNIISAHDILLEYFDGDEDAVNMILGDAVNNPQEAMNAVQEIKEETEKLNKQVLGDRTLDEIKEDYQTQYKAIYGTDFVPDELSDKVMNAKATGGMVKLAAITAISVLVTKSPQMTEIMSAAAGSTEAAGTAAAMIRTLSSKYGTTAVQQGIKFAMTSGTLAEDVGLTLLNQATSEKGVDGEELLESAKSSAKYIYFGAYVGSPLSQIVSSNISKIGAAGRLFKGGTVTTQGALQTTSVTGEKFVSNFMQGGNQLLAKAGGFATDVAAFTALETATEGADITQAGQEQTEMLGKLKVMNHFIEYMLGGKVSSGMSKTKMDLAIENSGVKNWTIKEVANPTKTVYEVQVEEGMPPIRFNDVNELQSVMMSVIAGKYTGTVSDKTPESEVKTESDSEVKQETLTEETAAAVKSDESIRTPKTKNTETTTDEAPAPQKVVNEEDIAPAEGPAPAKTPETEVKPETNETAKIHSDEVLEAPKTSKAEYTETFKTEAEKTDVATPAENHDAAKVLKTEIKPETKTEETAETPKPAEVKIDIETVKKEAEERSITDIEISEDNAELMHTLLTAKDENENYTYDYDDIRYFARKANDIDSKTAIELINMKEYDGRRRFSPDDVVYLSDKNKNSDKKTAVIELANLKNSYGHYRFEGSRIRDLIDDKLNEKIVIELAKVKDSAGYYIFGTYDIIQIAANKNIDPVMVKDLINMKNPDGNPRFYKNDLDSLLDSNLDQKTVTELANLKDSDENYRMSTSEIVILSQKNLNHNAIENILSTFKNISPDTVIKLADNKSEISEFLSSSTYMDELKLNSAGKYQKEVMELLNPENMTDTQLNSILDSGLSKSDYLEGVKKLSKSTFKLAYDKPNQYLSGIDLEYSTPVDGKLPQLSADELARERSEITEFFKDNTGLIVRTLKYIDTDTVSHMMDKRTNLFLESLNDLNELSDENMALLSKLLTCKSETTGKNLSPKEKIELCRIMEIFQTSNLETSEFESYAESGSVDINAAKRIVDDKIMQRAGVDPNNTQIKDDIKFNEEYSYLLLLNQTDNEIGNMMAERSSYYSMFDEIRNDSAKKDETIKSLEEQLEEANTAFPSACLKSMEDCLEMVKNIDNYSNEQLFNVVLESTREITKLTRETDELFTVIRETATGDFKEFIMDESNIYGQTNKKTQQIFEENGLDYDKWLNPDIEDVTVETGGKSMRIKMWDRDPQEDLFMGNKTTCCTAIGTGGNAAATPSYLLNTSYNVVEMYDSNGNVVGMSRVFMGKIDGEPTLIMDNIELNKTYTKDMYKEQLKEIRNGFFDYMNQYAEQVTGDENAQVRFYSCDIHVPHLDLERETKVTDFVGAFTSSSEKGKDCVYVNSACCSWIEPVKLKEFGEIDWLIVPKESSKSSKTLTDETAVKTISGREDIAANIKNASEDKTINTKLASEQEDIITRTDENAAKSDLTKQQDVNSSSILDVKTSSQTDSFGVKGIFTEEQLSLTSKDLLTGQDKKVLTEEGEELVQKAAAQIRKTALEKESDIVKIMEDMGLVPETDKEYFSHRSKSLESLHDKIKNALIDNKDRNYTLEDAINSVKDAVGVRTINKSSNIASDPSVKQYIDAGDMQTAKQKAVELESDFVLQALKKYIDQKAAGENTVEIFRIANYEGEDGIPYFTEHQLNELRSYALDKGLDLPVIERVKNFFERESVTDVYNKNATTKVRGSGYTALQMNFKTLDGYTYEWQFRGDKLNNFAEGEHIPYDLRTNKDIIGTHTELQKLYEPMKELLTDKNVMTDEMYEEYNNYLTAYYEYLRLTELGFEDGTNPPKLPKGFDERLRAENLELLHETAEKIKKNPEQEEELLQKYEANLIRNTEDNVTTESGTYTTAANTRRNNRTIDEYEASVRVWNNNDIIEACRNDNGQISEELIIYAEKLKDKGFSDFEIVELIIKIKNDEIGDFFI